MSNNDDVLFIYEWFKKSMSYVGKRISQPRCKDFTKTYQYRSAGKFVNKARAYGLSRDQCQILVKEIVKYAKEHKILYRGVAMLNMSGIFDICCKRLELNLNMTDAMIDNIVSSVSRISAFMPLHVPKRLGGYSNLNSAVSSGEIPIELVAISKRCINALRLISQVDRELLPSEVELLKIRIHLLMDSSIRAKLKKILGSDFVDTGVPQ